MVKEKHKICNGCQHIAVNCTCYSYDRLLDVQPSVEIDHSRVMASATGSAINTLVAVSFVMLVVGVLWPPVRETWHGLLAPLAAAIVRWIMVLAEAS